MSNYSGRRAPNVSQYLQGLNTVPTAQEMAQTQEGFDFNENDLSLFTNTEFFDFDLGTDIPEVASAQPLDYDPMAEERARRQNASAAFRQHNPKPVDFTMNGDFQSIDFSAFPVGVAEPTFSQQAASGQAYPAIQPHSHAQSKASTPTSSSASPTTVPNKRKLDSFSAPSGSSTAVTTSSSAAVIEEQSRLVAEEDKRRRNTAASARFRVKKKQREQQLEKSAKEMGDKVNSLESRIAQLEMENKWLKGLITEKNDGKSGGDIAELYRKFVSADKDDRHCGERTDGVGTAKA